MAMSLGVERPQASKRLRKTAVLRFSSVSVLSSPSLTHTRLPLARSHTIMWRARATLRDIHKKVSLVGRTTTTTYFHPIGIHPIVPVDVTRSFASRATRPFRALVRRGRAVTEQNPKQQQEQQQQRQRATPAGGKSELPPLSVNYGLPVMAALNETQFSVLQKTVTGRDRYVLSYLLRTNSIQPRTCERARSLEFSRALSLSRTNSFRAYIRNRTNTCQHQRRSHRSIRELCRQYLAHLWWHRCWLWSTARCSRARATGSRVLRRLRATDTGGRCCRCDGVGCAAQALGRQAASRRADDRELDSRH